MKNWFVFCQNREREDIFVETERLKRKKKKENVLSTISDSRLYTEWLFSLLQGIVQGIVQSIVRWLFDDEEGEGGGEEEKNDNC